MAKQGKKKVMVPKKLQNPIIQWYHVNLRHPGQTRTLLTIQKHFDWLGVNNETKNFVKAYELCGKVKLIKKGHSRNTFSTCSSEYSRPWKIHLKHNDGKQTLEQIWIFTILDVGSNWIEIHPISNKQSANIAQIFNYDWLC